MIYYIAILRKKTSKFSVVPFLMDDIAPFRQIVDNRLKFVKLYS